MDHLHAMHHKIPPFIKNLHLYRPGKNIQELLREKNLTHASKLASNENPLGPSPLAISEMSKALGNLHRYPESQSQALKAEIARIYRKKAENIIIGNGSEAIISHIMRTFLQPEDMVLTSEDTFVGFYLFAQSVGANIIKTPLTKDYKYDIQAIKNKLNPKIKILYIANPNNPTGTYLTKDELSYLMDYVHQDCLVIIDEAYFEYAAKNADYPNSLEYQYDNLITTRTFSKAYGLAGIRIGYAISSKPIIDYLSRIKLPFEPNSVAQAGALAALKDSDHLEKSLLTNEQLYAETKLFLSKNHFQPIETATNFIPFVVGNYQAANALYQELLGQGIIVRPIKGYNDIGFIRLSIGQEKEMNHFFDAMKTVLPAWEKRFGRPQ